MAEEKRNLCAQIPISLHSRVRQEQEASGSEPEPQETDQTE